MIPVMRRYFLDPAAALPDEITILIWPYPSSVRVVMPVFAHAALGIPGSVVGGLLKFYPFGFWLIYKLPDNRAPRLSSLLERRSTALDDIVPIEVAMSPVVPIDWPEAPRRSELVFFTAEQATFATPLGDLHGPV